MTVSVHSTLKIPWTLLCRCVLGDAGCRMMDDAVDLGDTSQCPSSQPHVDVDTENWAEFGDPQTPATQGQVPATGRGRGRIATTSARCSSAPSQTHAATLHKVRGPNWTEAEMLVLIGQKRIEWDGRHNSNQPSLAKFVYGTTAWKLVLAGCMSVVGFRARDADQITNKWDGLIKDYKKLKDYIEGTGSANWWGMSREQKKVLSKSRKMPLEFSESMYAEMEGFVGKRVIFGRAADVLDSDRVSQPSPRNFGRSPSAPRVSPTAAGGSPASSSATRPVSPLAGTPGDSIPGSTGRKRKSSGNESLVDFVKDFNSDYNARVEVQDRDKRAWRSDLFALDTAREARIALKEAQNSDMDEKLYCLEVERTKNLGNMTSALLMLASSMDALTRFCAQPLLVFILASAAVAVLGVSTCNLNFESGQDSRGGPPSPSSPPAMLSHRSRVPLVSGAGTHSPPHAVWRRCLPWMEDGTLSISDLECGPC